MPQIMPITVLRNTNEISETCRKTDEPIFITKNGYGDMVIMSIEVYDSLCEKWGLNKDTMDAIEEVEQMKKDPSIGKAYTSVAEMFEDILSDE